MLDPITAVTAPDPYPYYCALVRQQPAYRDEKLGLWVVSSAAAIEAILAAPAARVRPVGEPVPKALVDSPAGAVFGAFARMTDGPGQAAVKRALEATLVEITADRVAQVARAWMADRFGHGGPVHADSLDEVAVALPVAVVASLLGMPEGVHDDLRRSLADFVAGIGPSATAAQVAAGSDAAERLLEMLRAIPSSGAGILPRLLEAGATLTWSTILANALGLLFQTYDATAGLVGNTLLAATRHREAYARAVDTGWCADFVDEVQRHDPPVQNTRRYLATDIELSGLTMRRGDAVLLVLAAANRDPAANEAPDRFDIDRAARRSFTFGMGRHACPGRLIATTIAAVAAECLVPRLADPDRLVQGVRYRPLPNARIPVFSRTERLQGART
jgi:cytochrome P450